MEEAKTRIKITVGDATIEVEGSQDYIEKKLKEPESFDGLMKKAAGVIPVTAAKPKVTKGKKKATAKGVESHKLVSNLDLSGTDTVPSLKDFCKEKKPTYAQECNAVFIYYLKKMLEIEKVGIDHVYTCYKTAGVKVPGRLYQSLLDTRKVKGWIITDNMDDLLIGTLGENFVEKELPKSQQSQ